MKITLLYAVISTALLLLSDAANAQIKVFPNNKVLMGRDLWGAGYSRTEELFVNGKIAFNHQPAISDIFIQNYPYQTNGQVFNLLSIVPQWGNTNCIGLPTAQLWQIHSQEIHSNGVFIFSDSLFKRNIVHITGPTALDLVLQLKAYRYDFNDRAYVGSHESMLPILRSRGANQIGLLAQEVRSVLPEAVQQDETGNLSVNYIMLIPLLLESIKEQQHQIAELQAQINQLQQH